MTRFSQLFLIYSWWAESRVARRGIESMKPIDVSVIIACYNEGDDLGKSIAYVTSVLDDSRFSYEFIFVDDGSTDRTREIITGLVRKNKNFRAVFHDVNQGRGKTVCDGIVMARGKVVGFIDIDLEVSPVYIPSFVRMIMDHHADVVTGLRIYREGLHSVHRAILSRGYAWLSRSSLGIALMDTETGYKFFDRKKILPVVQKTKYKKWFWDTEIMTLAYYSGLRIREIPVLFIRRFDKQSSVRLVGDTLVYLRDLWMFHKRLVKKGFFSKFHV
jgi:glycosyltransferase involved in cell wall biosynthesis